MVNLFFFEFDYVHLRDSHGVAIVHSTNSRGNPIYSYLMGGLRWLFMNLETSGRI